MDALRSVLLSCDGLDARAALDRVMAAYTPEDHEDDTCTVALRLARERLIMARRGSRRV
ncbi:MULTISPECIES: hypothetical protein [unclassified Streptomyces]|uniref:hypothetical protein n=1 Tax=unclassified Streptomyces TaxID=2593676 RepID=UPI00365261E6